MYNFRLAILQELQSMGYKILIIAPKDEYTHKFYALGFESVHLPISSHSLNPLKDLKTYFCLRKIFQKHHPDFIFHYTIKPIIYGSLAAKDIPNIAITTGLGHAFLANNPLRKALKLLVCWLYRISLRHAREVWFLNQDDRDEFLAQKILCEKKCKILDSEGIDTQYFAPRNDTQALAEKNSNHIEPSYTSSPPEREFLLIARMLKEKGIEEFLHAADNFKK
ncbi:glycosyltransferase [Helicobacter mustelae]|uniref:glycosyltransferase n=1 Tax=Helicobacter mustelae TaxID=217 RepID=UPI000326672F|nr:glycosyltransferase [Helicobacter mustelae]SQH71437.1 glycosyltransferase [Helicobacter mustelae]